MREDIKSSKLSSNSCLTCQIPHSEDLTFSCIMHCTVSRLYVLDPSATTEVRRNCVS